MASSPSLKCWKLIVANDEEYLGQFRARLARFAVNSLSFEVNIPDGRENFRKEIATFQQLSLLSHSSCHARYPYLVTTMTSSLRNSIHRRNHKERSQLAHRSKLGFLEKHKDYVKRARDYHSKQDRLTRLRQKASERNKDEFYFSMNKEKTRVSGLAGSQINDF